MAPRTHNWPEKAAESARNNFGLNKPRPYKADNLRKTKKRERRTVKFHCPMKHCEKEVTRLRNHLRQKHGKEKKKEIDRLVASAIIVNPLPDDILSSSSEEEEQNTGEKVPYTPFFEIINEEDSDSDYVDERYCQKGRKLPEPSQLEQEEEQEDISDDDDSADDEDEDERFVVSSKGEDDLMAEFINFLVSIDGGSKPLRCAKRHSKVVMAIVRSDSQCVDYNNLTKRNFLVNWIDNFNGKPGTTKTYLCSLKHFFNYCTTKNRDIIDLTKIDLITTLIKQWKRSLWKKVRREKHQKDLADLENMPKTEDLLQFDNSDHVKNSIKTLSILSASESIGRQDFCLVRDYVLSTLILDNCSRPGALANMTLQEFRKAKKEKEAHVVGVCRHKTDYNGPAFISISPELIDDMRKYVASRNRLPGIGNRDGDPVFVSWSGNAMTSNMINVQFQRFWKNAVPQTSTITSTLVRKFTTTVVHENLPELKRKTANLLCHSEKTATEHYALYEKSKTAASTSSTLRKSLRSASWSSTSTGRLDDAIKKHFDVEISSGDVTISLVRQKMSQYVDLRQMSEKQIVDRIRYLAKTTGPVGDVECQPDEDTSIEDTLPSVVEKRSRSSISTRKRTAYTFLDVELIRKHLSQFFDKNEPLIKSEVTNHIKGCSELQQLLKDKGMSSLLIKVRTERDKE